MTCEHGLTTKECYVCMSPKYGEKKNNMSITAMKQALEALNETVKFFDGVDLDNSFNPPTAKWAHNVRADALWSITSLRQAIEQAEKQEQTRSQKLRDAGFTRRPKGWERDAEQAEKQGPVADSAFEKWWDEEGSTAPKHRLDCEEHCYQIAKIAWSNGAYKAQESYPPAAPVQDNEFRYLKQTLDATIDINTQLKRELALYKMAENARELGLDYEPVQNTQSSIESAASKAVNYRTDYQKPLTVRLQQLADRYDAMKEELGAIKSQLAAQMRMPKIGDRVICIEDESLATVESLTGGGSPDIKFDDGSHGTYLLREFAELFRYADTAPQQRERIVFPTMLRKMWSGGEVQAWLEENVNKEKNHVS